jgi:hypothetical protein
MTYMNIRRREPLASMLALIASFGGAAGYAAAPETSAPIVYEQPAYQSPVRGDPDDLLLLPGMGFTAQDIVVYQALPDTTARLSPPNEIPTQSSEERGIAPIVSTEDLPLSLTVRLPRAMRANESYALWVHDPLGQWSRPVKINDARPLWVSPAFVYSSTRLAGLSRYIKLIGRNLQPAPGHRTQVRLVGPQAVTLTAVVHPKPWEDLDRYAAWCALPARLVPGRYHVLLSRDDRSWVALPDQTLEVRPDPVTQPIYAIDSPAFGGCHPNDGKDDTACIVKAVAAAKAAGGGTVLFKPGVWDLSDGAQPGVVPHEGIILERGVSLRGAGAARSSIVRHPSWQASGARPAFALVGDNSVQDLTLSDAQVFGPSDHSAPFLQLGETFQRVMSRDPNGLVSVHDIVITDNVFNKPFVAVSDGGLPIERLFITHNVFGSYSSSLELTGNRFNMNYKFRIDDAVISGNTFQPGSYVDTAHRTGVLATEFGAGFRVDFSDNIADGVATDYLYSPADARGWRAAFFWNMNNNQELELVSHNVADCTGDKIGDGEAMSYDNNGNTFALDSAQTVLAATADSITVAGPLRTTQNDRTVPLPTYYVGHWIQVGAGPGLGQVRKITSYTVDATSGRVTFHIAPDWDVEPASGGSRISVGREFWQVYTVANTIDQRRPPCGKSNISDRKGGGITLWAQAADSVIEGNRQFDTDGILWQELYSVRDTSVCPDCVSQTNYIDFLEVRDNLIDGEYDWADGCSSSGITGSLAAAPSPRSPPPTVGYGLSIANNIIRRADARDGGAISFVAGWYKGPPPYRWPLVADPLIFHNVMSGFWSAPANPCGKDRPRDRTGISLRGSSLVSHSVLYDNSCPDTPQSLDSGGQSVIRVCPRDATSRSHSCECPDPRP